MPKYKKRPDGLYQVNINLGRRSDGKYQRKTVYANTIRELEDKIQAVKTDINNGVMPGDASKISFKQLSAIWLDKFSPNVSEQGKSQYSGLLRLHINPAFGEMRLKDIKKADLQSLLNEMVKNGASMSQLRKIKMVSASVMEMAAENRLISYNPFKGIKMPAVPQKRREAITDEQKRLIFENWQGHRMGVPALIMLLCGLRRGELIALQWSDIDLDAGKLTVNKAAAFDRSHKPIIKTTKTNAGKREIEIPAALLSALRQSRRTSLYVCPASEGGIMTYSAFKRAWESYMHYLNICAGGADATRSKPKVIAMQPFTPHQLRHTYATMLYSAGVDLLTAQKLLGHTDVKVTMGIYTHLEDERRKVSISSLNEYISSAF